MLASRGSVSSSTLTLAPSPLRTAKCSAVLPCRVLGATQDSEVVQLACGEGTRASTAWSIWTLLYSAARWVAVYPRCGRTNLNVSVWFVRWGGMIKKVQLTSVNVFTSAPASISAFTTSMLLLFIARCRQFRPLLCSSSPLLRHSLMNFCSGYATCTKKQSMSKSSNALPAICFHTFVLKVKSGVVWESSSSTISLFPPCAAS